MIGWLLLAALVLGGVGLWLWVRAGAARRESGLPAGRVIYADTGAWDRCERPLFSDRYRLTGRPDYLVHSPNGVIPVEIKSGPTPDAPYPAHILQLAAYCLLVEEQEGRAPPYGILSYQNRAFEVEYTPALRARLEETLRAMREGLHAHELDRSHREQARCQGCGYWGRCDQRLE